MTDDIDRYADQLISKGVDEREVARAYFYAREYGLRSLTGPVCREFAEPTCDDGWNCVNPRHQRLE